MLSREIEKGIHNTSQYQPPSLSLSMRHGGAREIDTDRKGKWKNRKIEQFHYLRCRIPSYTIGITFLLPMMFYFTPPAGIMLHHQGWNIFRPLGMYSSSSSHPDGTLFESPVRWRGEKRKLPPPPHTSTAARWPISRPHYSKVAL
jgi:hypothetical protein